MTFRPLRQADKSAAACRWDVRAALGKNPGNTSYWLRYFPQALASKLKRLNISSDQGSESNRRQHRAHDKMCVMWYRDLTGGGGLWSCSGSCRVSMLLKLCCDAGGLQCCDPCDRDGLSELLTFCQERTNRTESLFLSLLRFQPCNYCLLRH